MLAGIGVTNWRGRSMRPSAPRGLADGITKTIIAFGVLSDQFDLVFEMRRYFGLATPTSGSF